jgi:hypothetical protein
MLVALSLTLLRCRQGRLSDHFGTYVLTTIDGNQLPFNPTGAGRGPQFRSGAITLQPNGNFKSALTYRMPDGQVATRDSSGSYTREGSSFKLQWNGAGVTTGTLEGSTFTIEDDGLRCVYRK